MREEEQNDPPQGTVSSSGLVAVRLLIPLLVLGGR